MLDDYLDFLQEKSMFTNVRKLLKGKKADAERFQRVLKMRKAAIAKDAQKAREIRRLQTQKKLDARRIKDALKRKKEVAKRRKAMRR